MNQTLKTNRPIKTKPFVLFAALVAGLVFVQTLHADNPPAYIFQWGSPGSGNGQFSHPQGIAIDSSNNVYVADTANDRIQKFDNNGNYLTQWGTNGSGNGQFDFPEPIAIDSSNDVYVADTSNDRIEKFDSNGNYLTQWGSSGSGNGQFSYPQGIAIDSSNNVYVTDFYNDRIEKFDSNGNYLTQWGSQGLGNGQFSYPQGIAIDSSNNVYVADLYNDRIEKFDSNGNYLTQWGSQGLGNGQFEGPGCVTIDSSNNIYAVDNYDSYLGNDCRIEKFDSNGNYLTQWGNFGSGNGQFDFPYGIAIDSNNNVYVADTSNYRVQVFANNTSQLRPYITSQPTTQSVPVGATVSLNVAVLGGSPLSFQWTSNSIALPNATNSTYTITNVQVADAATYAVQVTNNLGSASSSNAVLTVLPVVVATLPASSVSSTGAVLNGSVTVGPDESIAWFDWGTDTNYGNIADATLIDGGTGSNYLTVALTGLPGNFYHYRLVAANDYGIVYGNDEAFVVGSAPTVTTLTAVNSSIDSTFGSTLNATVNPNGWDTTVYFRWGINVLTNITPAIDIGAGVTAVNVSSFITGLAPGAQYHCYITASNHIGTRTGITVAFTPPFNPALSAQWQSVACSADGTRLVAGATEGPSGTYISTDRGVTWVEAITSKAEGVAASADGTELLAVVAGTGAIHVSTNSGAVWTTVTNAPHANWNAIASSADGAKLAAVAEDVAGVYASTDSGVNWTLQTNGLLPMLGYDYIASSADGSKLVAAAGGSTNGPIFTSTNSGVNWAEATNAPLARWYSVASSADGNVLMACAYFGGNVYLSTDGGVTWVKTSLPTNNWNSVAESADGTRMVALANSGLSNFGTGRGGIYTSADSGASWVSNNVPSGAWTCAAMSADGNEIIASIGAPSSIGGICVLQTTPRPVLNLTHASGEFILSWIIPSMNFGLQQGLDLSSWSAVTNFPVLNLTNLQDQVILPPATGSSFFRLKQQ